MTGFKSAYAGSEGTLMSGETRMMMNDRGDRGAKRLDGGPSANTSKQLQSHIGSQLRQMFDEVVQEPIPDRLQRLLADLEKTEKGAKEDGA